MIYELLRSCWMVLELVSKHWSRIRGNIAILNRSGQRTAYTIQPCKGDRKHPLSCRNIYPIFPEWLAAISNRE